MRFLIRKLFFILVVLFALLFALSNQAPVALEFWPFVGVLVVPLFWVVLSVFVAAFFMGVIYSKLMHK